MKAARLVADVIEQAGVRRVFCVPGESYLALLNELGARPSVRVVTNRHESGAAFMAEGYAKASGGVGVCMGSRAPGALNLSIGLHAAMQDATPVVAFIGQVATAVRGRDAFQEVELARLYSHVVKWSAEVGRADRAAEYVARAFSVAVSGRPGPVAVVLPEDVISADVEPAAAAKPVFPEPPEPAPEAVRRALDWILAAERPVVMAGRGVVRAGAVDALVELAETLALPVYTAWRRQDAFPNHHGCYAGGVGLANHPEVVRALREADLVLGIGTQWNEVTSLGFQVPRGRLVHVDVDPELLATAASRLPAREVLPIVADAGRFLKALKEALPAQRQAVPGGDSRGGPAGIQPDSRRGWVARCHARYWELSEARPRTDDGFVHPEGVMASLSRLLPPEAAIVSDAGNFASWYLRFFRFRLPGTHFAPVSGSMGYGLPAAIGVALADRDSGRWGPGGRPVVLMAGDGGFLMTACELATAVRERVRVVALVFVNGLYGTIVAHQRRQTDDPRLLALNTLHNPDFAALARSFGAYGEVVTDNGAFEEAFRRALQAQGPAVLELRIHPDRLHALHS